MCYIFGCILYKGASYIPENKVSHTIGKTAKKIIKWYKNIPSTGIIKKLDAMRY